MAQRSHGSEDTREARGTWTRVPGSCILCPDAAGAAGPQVLPLQWQLPACPSEPGCTLAPGAPPLIHPVTSSPKPSMAPNYLQDKPEPHGLACGGLGLCPIPPFGPAYSGSPVSSPPTSHDNPLFPEQGPAFPHLWVFAHTVSAI